MIRRRLIALIAIAPLTVSTAAFAFWSGQGTGTASAATATLSSPSNAAASTTPGVGTAHLTWSAAHLSTGADVVGYYATRVGATSTAAACGTSPTSLTTALSCDDTSVPDGDYHYVVTAVQHSWIAASSPSNDVTIINDSTLPSVSINQAADQADPTNAAPVHFSVAFSEPVTGFDGADITLSGTAGATAAAVTGTGATYNVDVSGMTSSGTVTVGIGAGAAHDAVGNLSVASTSSDDTVTYDTIAPTVTVEQKSTQQDPTKNLPILYSVTFSEPVTGFDQTDITRTGSATGGTVGVSGGGAVYEISFSGTPTGGTVSFSIDAGKAKDAAGNTNAASTSLDNTVTYDYTGPTNTISLQSPTSAFLSGTSLYFAADLAGSFNLLNSMTDTQASPASTDFPALTATRWATHANETVTTPSGGPFLSRRFDWASGSAVPGDYTVTGTSTNGRSTPTTLHFISDTTAPTGDISYHDGYLAADSVQVTVTPATDAGSGINEEFTVVQRSVGDLGADGTCSGFTDYSNVDLVDGVDEDIALGSCYKYQYVMWDNVDHYTIVAPTSVTKIVTDTLSGGSISYADGYTTTTAIPITVVEGAGAAGSTVQRSVAPLTVTGCGTFGPYLDTTITAGVNVGTNGNCYMYRLVVTDQFGQTLLYTSTNVVKVDTVKPTVTINQKVGQADPAINAASVDFTATFSEAVTGFDGSDVTLSGTAGATTAIVTGSGPTYTVTVSGLAKTGTVIAAIVANGVTDLAENTNTASTSSDNTITYQDTVKPSVTINQATGQADPTTNASVNFTATFSEPVASFDGTDLTYGGTAAGTKTGTVTGGPTTYNIAVTGMTNNGTVTATLAASKVPDLSGNTNNASTSTDNTVQYTDITGPSVAVEQAAGQADPTNASTVNFTLTFNEVVSGLTNADIAVGGTAAGSKTVNITGSGPYNVAVGGITGSGTVTASMTAASVTDAAGNANTASTSTDNTVTIDKTAPTLTISKAIGQADPTRVSPVTFTAVFSEPVTGLTTGDITSTAPGSETVGLAAVSSTTYTITIGNLTSSGNVSVSIGNSAAQDATGNQSTASNTATVVFDVTSPTVTVSKASAQVDPTNATTINFTAVFSEAVTGFAEAHVTVGGTAGGTKTAVVSGTGPSYNVAVSGMTGTGTVTVTIGAATVTDAAGNPNTASTGSNSVTFDNVPPTVVMNSFTTTPSTNVAAASGTATGGTGNVTVVFCAVDAWPCTGSNIKATLTDNNNGGTWSVSTTLANNVTVYARATQVDALGNLGVSGVIGPKTT